MKVLGRYGSGGRSGQVVASAENPANGGLVDRWHDRGGNYAEFDGGTNSIVESSSGKGVACGWKVGLGR
jgi:hypothetical protein